MRQRRLKDIDERMADLAAYIDTDGTGHKGRWREVFAGKGNIIAPEAYAGLFLEIGCGKGKFICDRAEALPEWNIIGIEGQESVIVRAAEKVRERNIDNVYLISNYVRDLRDFFDDCELDGIFLNFSDPWPKAKHEKRRLTCRKNLEAYMSVIKPGSFIDFKTDNEGLYDFTMGEIKAMGYKIAEKTEDLHNTSYSSARFTTEYEEKFIKKGAKIKFVRIIKE